MDRERRQESEQHQDELRLEKANRRVSCARTEKSRGPVSTARTRPEAATGTSTRNRFARAEPEKPQIQRHNGADEKSDAKNVRAADRGVAPSRCPEILGWRSRLDGRQKSLH
jgi:hypothetical protein